jgi:translation elongation factor P/translation initiation factor 5A
VTDTNEMECVEISEVKTDLDNYQYSYTEGSAMCILDSEKNDQCKYYFKNSQGV